MISIKLINEKDIDLCYELDSNKSPCGVKSSGLTNLKKGTQKSLGYYFLIW